MSQSRQKLFTLQEMVMAAQSSRGGWELCATAEASYEDGFLIVELDSMIRPAHAEAMTEGLSQSWLPAKRTLRRRMQLNEARAEAPTLTAALSAGW
ncbi:MAG: hypothetical protein EBS05_03070 [Proteobacteria bacterium]|jgi:hypothetical protein|nr:hypothetical protein [Pseudomonadota bacterium]